MSTGCCIANKRIRGNNGCKKEDCNQRRTRKRCASGLRHFGCSGCEDWRCVASDLFRFKPDATVILLDPAAAYANQVAMRGDCTYVVTHPCHPALLEEQETPEARKDMFGGIAAKQDIVIALHQGKVELFERAEQICIEMFAPVVKCHRLTVEQMALLEPAAAEVVAAAA